MWYLTRCTNARALQVRLCGVYLFRCNLRKHLRRAARKVFNRPAPEKGREWEQNEFVVVDGVLDGVSVVNGTQRTKVSWATRPGLVFPVEGEERSLCRA